MAAHEEKGNQRWLNIKFTAYRGDILVYHIYIYIGI